MRVQAGDGQESRTARGLYRTERKEEVGLGLEGSRQKSRSRLFRVPGLIATASTPFKSAHNVKSAEYSREQNWCLPCKDELFGDRICPST